MRTFLVFIAFLMFSGNVFGQLKYVELKAQYDNGFSSTAAINAAIDTLIDNLDADTVKFGLVLRNERGLPKNAYPEFVVVFLENAEDINNGERITIIDEYGTRDITVEGTLALGDTITSAATAGISGRFVYNTGSVTGDPGSHLQLIINQLASAAATDSISYRLRAFGLYKLLAR